jgi:GNAT superfamily N-acetyltransferase
LQVQLRAFDTSEIGRAHNWHEDFAATNDALYPRTAAHFLQLAMDRCVWGAISSNDEFLAMSYASFDEPKNQWEIGGLMVSPEARGKGLGTLMMKLPLAHVLFTEDPLASTPPASVVTHVLKGNEAPRSIVPAVGFTFHEPVFIPSDAMPGLRAEPDGMVHGDEFQLVVPEALISLAKWAEEWPGELRDGTPARIDLLPGYSLTLWAQAFRDMADRSG